MSFYVYQLVVVLILGHMASRCRRTSLAWWLFWSLVFLSLFVPAAIRYDIGTDYYKVYVPEFFSTEPDMGVNRWEPGFVAIADFVLNHRLDVQWMFAISSFITYMLVLLAFPRKGFHLCLFGYFVACYLSSYNGVRQHIGIGFALLAFMFQGRGQWVLPIFLVACGCLFHLSLAICLPIAIGVMIAGKMRTKALLAVFAAVFLLSLAFNPVQVALDIANKVPVLAKYTVYAIKEEQMAKSGTTGLGHLLWIMIFLVQAVLLLFRTKSPFNRRIAIWCLVAVVFRAMNIHATILERFYMTASAVLPFSLMATKRACKDFRDKIIFCGIVFMVLLAFFHSYGFDSNVTGPDEVLPYRTIFD